ncbi:MAG: glycosyltransferase, partial [Deltaproteobacteria bacterium]|nr:glycosyltransferase [Deltaproteobacteria bacterium]
MDRCYHGPGRALRRFSPRHAVLAGCERFVFANPTQIIQCGSEMVRGEIQRRHGVAPQRLAVVRNGVDLDGFRPGAPQSVALRATWGRRRRAGLAVRRQGLRAQGPRHGAARRGCGPRAGRPALGGGAGRGRALAAPGRAARHRATRSLRRPAARSRHDLSRRRRAAPAHALRRLRQRL